MNLWTPASKHVAIANDTLRNFLRPFIFTVKRSPMDYKRTAVVFAMASILVLSLVTSSGLMRDSFAATAAAKAPTVATQHIPYSDSLSIDSITVSAKAMKTKPASNVQVQIVQNGEVKGSAVINSKSLSSIVYRSITANFNPPVKVKGDFDVVFKGNGLTILIVKENGQTGIPGFVTTTDSEDRELDAYFTINGKSIAKALADGRNSKGDDEKDKDNKKDDKDNNKETDKDKDKNDNKGDKNADTATISFLTKRYEDKKTEITGMHFVVYKGLEKIGE